MGLGGSRRCPQQHRTRLAIQSHPLASALSTLSHRLLNSLLSSNSCLPAKVFDSCKQVANRSLGKSLILPAVANTEQFSSL